MTRARVGVLALVSGAVAINYLDRALLGIATPLIQGELQLDDRHIGWLLSAFSWTYFLSQVPVGILLDRYRVGALFLGSLLAWSGVTLLHSMVPGFALLIVLRLLLGLAESPCFPASNQIISTWFPRQERSRAIAVYTAAEYIALGFLSPVLYFILRHLGWRALFAIAGSIGVVYALAIARRYRSPEEHAGVSDAELALIRQGGAVRSSATPAQSFRWSDVAALFRHRQLWGLCVGQFAVYSTFVFFLTWFPSYLARERHMGWIKLGFFASLPYIAGFFGILAAGWWSDAMLRRGVSLSRARKVPVIVGLLGASTIVAVNYTRSNSIAVAIMAFAFFCQAMSSSGWAAVSEIAPKGKLGLVSGLFSASANLSGIVVPIVIGELVQATGSFVAPLAFVALIAAVGAFCWIVLVGDLRPLEDATPG